MSKGFIKAGRGITIVADWEERISLFLQEAIDTPHMEPEVCEKLIEYIQHLVRQDRHAYRQQAFNVVYRMLGVERREENFSDAEKTKARRKRRQEQNNEVLR